MKGKEDGSGLRDEENVGQSKKNPENEGRRAKKHDEEGERDESKVNGVEGDVGKKSHGVKKREESYMHDVY